ncbi:peroxiredoxin [Candidatus Falkowbacteria bacterium CG10_big_fil_rev_8_21_14_0_10_37_6]|uniref:Peroxiredoxin n=1 Tax=Candidatus Falkowbacteria bacterium CG10_big_fil_rev_8_21_14_0_10_37_6 TaxID=1974563 RepID=A0A2H0V9B9_9BACT|nr:MAG: peroxiredoxin [Candidatus Falkowbacteria bacterium CG10_big_fil_rev_8_21_14_0_10_37_6]
MENIQENRLPLINKQAPEMELEAFHENKIIKIKLSDYLGKWLILFFYPADFTFVCPTELEEMAELYEKFQNENAEILSASTDTAFAHKAWHDNSPAIKKIKFPMLADPTGKLCKALGVYIQNEGLALRGSFIIDPDGIIKSCEINDNNIGRSGEELLRRLQAAKFVREHGGEVCPAKWKPGEKTLKPGIDLIGKL